MIEAHTRHQFSLFENLESRFDNVSYPIHETRLSRRSAFFAFQGTVGHLPLHHPILLKQSRTHYRLLSLEQHSLLFWLLRDRMRSKIYIYYYIFIYHLITIIK